MNASPRELVCAEVDWRADGVEVIGRLHALRQAATCPTCPAPPAPAVLVATCHRLEIHAEGLTDAAAVDSLAASCGIDGADKLSLVAVPVVRRGKDAARHLFRVAAGLESAVPGEDQILRQLRQAYREAVARHAVGPILHRAFHTAFRTGRRVRSETDLAGGGHSLAGTAVNAVQRAAGGLHGRPALVIGAGKTAGLLALRLRQRGAGPLLIANRTADRASRLAARVGGRVIPWPWRSGMLSCVDIVATATGATEPVVSAEQLESARKRSGRPLFVVDLGVPPDVECPPGGSWQGHYLGVSELTAMISGDRERRRRSIARAERIVAEELDSWLAWCVHRAGRRRAQVF